jgi:hypothetical protein
MIYHLVNNVDLTPIKKNTSMNLEDIPSTQDFDRSGLLKHVLDQFKISRDGDHGPGHWARVRLHGLKVGAPQRGRCANLRHHSVLLGW